MRITRLRRPANRSRSAAVGSPAFDAPGRSRRLPPSFGQAGSIPLAPPRTLNDPITDRELDAIEGLRHRHAARRLVWSFEQGWRRSSTSGLLTGVTAASAALSQRGGGELFRKLSATAGRTDRTPSASRGDVLQVQDHENQWVQARPLPQRSAHSFSLHSSSVRSLGDSSSAPRASRRAFPTPGSVRRADRFRGVCRQPYGAPPRRCRTFRRASAAGGRRDADCSLPESASPRSYDRCPPLRFGPCRDDSAFREPGYGCHMFKCSSERSRSTGVSDYRSSGQVRLRTGERLLGSWRWWPLLAETLSQRRPMCSTCRRSGDAYAPLSLSCGWVGGSARWDSTRST